MSNDFNSLRYFLGGVLLNSYGTTFWVLLVANGLLLGPAQSLIDVTTMTAVYHFFVDKHVYLFTSIVSSGLGLGMILVSTLFIFLKPTFGTLLHSTFNKTCYFCSSTLFVAFTQRSKIHKSLL